MVRVGTVVPAKFILSRPDLDRAVSVTGYDAFSSSMHSCRDRLVVYESLLGIRGGSLVVYQCSEP